MMSGRRGRVVFFVDFFVGVVVGDVERVNGGAGRAGARDMMVVRGRGMGAGGRAVIKSGRVGAGERRVGTGRRAVIRRRRMRTRHGPVRSGGVRAGRRTVVASHVEGVESVED